MTCAPFMAISFDAESRAQGEVKRALIGCWCIERGLGLGDHVGWRVDGIVDDLGDLLAADGIEVKIEFATLSDELLVLYDRGKRLAERSEALGGHVRWRKEWPPVQRW